MQQDVKAERVFRTDMEACSDNRSNCNNEWDIGL